ncbi:hypothetical protein [Paenibacillus xerothermodurans]|uniref:Uncharacterized protein n=1 Tax=Paenibacillus xerothermodurans TaxID=1977292 RepID=A0A2W1NM78_PAEXE|nr:hypothetical protein [Paenibacillus xerothermodurans]PZE20063.1 hypothetical protein CBW46_015395 [Paenibacillus xerothermodurans]
MKTQVFLHENIRVKNQKLIEIYVSTYYDKISAVYANIEEEANEKAENRYAELGSYFNPEYDDPSDFAELAWEAGIEHLQMMALMRYNTKLMTISTLYQFWEQQIRKFLYEELTRHPNINPLKGQLFKDFCARGFGDIRQVFEKCGVDIKGFDAYAKLNELRLLANLIKHGPGDSEDQLRKLRPDFFQDDASDIDRMVFYRTTLNEIVLEIDDEELGIYGESLIEFWEDIPQEMIYSS